ncbi:MAG: AAA family ATPase, partial [Anaerolineae bacterium]
SVQNDQNYMRRAMLAGARDFLSKPPTGDDLISAIRRAAEMSRNERAKSIPPRGIPVPTGTMTAVPGLIPYAQGKIITVYSPKGGTGCTTLAVNLAIALSNEDTRVILVDANLQFGDVAVFLNEQGKNTILELAPRITELDPQTIEEIMIKHQASGVHLLAAPQRPELAEKVSADQFSKVLEHLKALYGYLVVDSSPILTDVTLAALDASDIIVLVTTQDIPAIKNARLFLDLMHTMGVPKERIVLAINKYDRQISITPQRIGENFKQEVGAVIPTDERFVLPSVNKGVPFILGNKSHPVSRGIFSLAEAVRARLTALEAEEMDNRR